MDHGKAEWPATPQRTASEHLQRASTFGTEADLFPGTIRSSSFPSTAPDHRAATPDPDLSGLANSRYQAWDEEERPLSPGGDFLDDISGDSDIEEVIEDDSDADSTSEFEEHSTLGEGSKISFKEPVTKDRLQRDIFDVIRSGFTNYGNEGDDVEIALQCGLEAKSDDSYNLFRWIHLHNDVMDFDSFTEKSLRASRLKSSDRRMVREMLQDVRMKFEKPTWAQDATEARYMEPFVYQELTLHPAAEDSYLNRKITVVCFPFFLLDEPPKDIEILSRTNHPPLTLLQTLSSSMGLERDMQQVVCDSSIGQKSRCFYVSQLWGIIVDDSLLVTCARLPAQNFSRDAVSLSKEPTKGSPFIRVSDGGNCTWQLPITHCETWFGFTAYFMEVSTNQLEVARSFDDLYDITWDGRAIKREDWKSVINKAREAPVHLILTRRTFAERFQVVHGVNRDDVSETTNDSEPSVHTPHTDSGAAAPPLQSESNQEAAKDSAKHDELSPAPAPPVARDFVTASPTVENNGSKNGPEKEKMNGDNKTIEPPPISEEYQKFHALSWYALPREISGDSKGHEAGKKAEYREHDLPTLLDRIHQRLLKHGSRRDKKAYRTSEKKNLPDVVKHLLIVTRDANQTQGYITSLSTLDTFFVAAVQIFELFLDLTNESEVAQKYWGSVLYVLKHVLVNPNWTSLPGDSIDVFKRIAYLANIIKNELSQPHGPRPGSVKIPQDFGRAFLHCLHFLTLFWSNTANEPDRLQHAEKFEALLHRARQLIWRNWTKVPLHRKEVASPLALFSVFINQLQKDISRFEVRPNIAHIYREYWKSLVIDVNSGRLKRSMPKFDPLQQEIAAVLKTLEHQVDLLTRFSRAIEQQSTGWTSYHSKHMQNALRPEIPMLQDCITHVVDRIQLFKTILDDSQKLEKWTDEHLTAFTKDRHDNAIYVFTIFTVIFLPLSFVCSFLGMNTSDVRNMSAGQSVFWAAALPLTLIVILIALVVTDELGEFWTTLRDKFGIPVRHLGITPRHEPSSYWRRTSGAQEMLKNISERKKGPKVRGLPAATGAELPKKKPKTEKINKLNQRAPTFGSIME